MYNLGLGGYMIVSSEFQVDHGDQLWAYLHDQAGLGLFCQKQPLCLFCAHSMHQKQYDIDNIEAGAISFLQILDVATPTQRSFFQQQRKQLVRDAFRVYTWYL